MKSTPYIILLLSLAACTAKAPQNAQQQDSCPSIWPDYTELTVPSNIAPLNFRIDEPGKDFVTEFTSETGSICVSGKKTDIPEKKWHALLADASRVSVKVYAKDNGKWKAYKEFTMTVSDPIDPYISYRLIPPSFEQYEELSIEQRSMESFWKKTIYTNTLVQDGKNGQCINCHHYRNYKTDNMQFHARQFMGGTIIVKDGEISKINLKTDSTLSAGVYPAWHPTHDYIAYSVNQTKQSIQITDPNRIEVQDMASDLILYNIKENAVSVIENDPDQFECFPAWAPDGKYLYYVSASYEAPFDDSRMGILMENYQELRYDLYRKPFNPETRTWGAAEKIIDAASQGQSITLPRVSPDGRYLMFAMGGHGIFHIWHKDSDLWMLDLATDSVRPLTEINSTDVESYHSWSSNGKWIIFSTRRDDGAYTRPYLAHLESDGTFSKPFALPQRDPDFSEGFMYSYNIPEFMIEPVSISPREFADALKEPAGSVSFQKSNNQ